METWDSGGRVLSPELEPDVCCAAAGEAQVLISAPETVAEWLARLIHQRSARASARFLAFDAELAGEEAAAALRSILDAPRPEGQTGTLFMRNVSHASREIQQVLLDWLTVNPQVTRPRLRIIAASSVWLLERVQAGSFDAQLFYRLNTIHITVNGRRRPSHAPALSRSRLGRHNLRGLGGSATPAELTVHDALPSRLDPAQLVDSIPTPER